MRRKTEVFFPVFIFCILIRPSTSSFKSIVSSLDNLEEVNDALQHSHNSLEDLTNLVFEVFTTETPTEAPTSVLTTLDTETSATASLATVTPTSGETATPKTDASTSESYSSMTTVRSITTTEDQVTTEPEIVTTEDQVTTEPEIVTTEDQVTTEPALVTTEDTETPLKAATSPKTTAQQTEKHTSAPTDSVAPTTIANLYDLDDISRGVRLYGESQRMFISSRKITPLHFLREMLVRILPHKLGVLKEIENYSGVSGATTEEPDTSESSTGENTSYTDEVTESETGTNTQETTTEVLTTTLGPWGDRVYSVLEDMMQVTSEISNGQADHEHAFRLEELATSLDDLVIEGAYNTSVLEGMSQEDLDYLNSVKDLTSDTIQDIKKEINKAKDDRQEVIVAITLLSILFVLVLVGLIVAMIRPWASGFRLPGSRKKIRNTHDDSSYISNVSFQDRSQQMRLNERRIHGEEVVV